MKMRSFWQVAAFREGQQEWKQYIERLEQYLIANEVENADKKRAIFLSTIGPQAYKLLIVVWWLQNFPVRKLHWPCESYDRPP